MVVKLISLCFPKAQGTTEILGVRHSFCCYLFPNGMSVMMTSTELARKGSLHRSHCTVSMGSPGELRGSKHVPLLLKASAVKQMEHCAISLQSIITNDLGLNESKDFTLETKTLPHFHDKYKLHR